MTAQASRRWCFDRDPLGYMRARPPYPSEVYDVLATHCGLRPGCRVLEIGPGTGQATAELLARGAEVVAVEPGAGLAAVLAERLGGEHLDVVNADFEHADVAPGPYDLVVAATSFHWVEPAVALPRIARLLAPGGWLAVWWTVFTDPDRPTPFRCALDALYARYLPGEPHGPGHTPGPLRLDSWSEELRRGGWFGPVEVDVLRWTHRLTAAAARRLWASFPNVNELGQGERDAFLDGVAQAVTRLGGIVDDPYVTAVYRTRPRGFPADHAPPAVAARGQDVAHDGEDHRRG